MPRAKKTFKCSRVNCGHVSKSQGEAVRHGWEHRRAEAKKAAKRAAAAPVEAVAVPAPRKPRVVVGPARITYTPSVEEMGVLLDHYKHESEKVDMAVAAIRKQLGGRTTVASTTSNTPTHRISAEGRAAIAAAQRRRWAEAKHQTAAAPAAT